MGFRTVTATLPANPGEASRPKTISTYHQSAACLGRVSEMKSLDGSGAVMCTEKQGMLTDTQVPLVCHNSSSESTEHQGTAAKTVKTARLFNLHGEVVREIDYGNAAVAGDEVTTWPTFYPNTTDFLTACPAIKATRVGAGVTTNPVIAYAQIRYDGAASHGTPSHGTPPTRCGLR